MPDIGSGPLLSVFQPKTLLLLLYKAYVFWIVGPPQNTRNSSLTKIGTIMAAVRSPHLPAWSCPGTKTRSLQTSNAVVRIETHLAK